MFSIEIDAHCVSSQISGHNCKISVLQQEAMGLPCLGKDASLRLVLRCEVGREALVSAERFRANSRIGKQFPLRGFEDVERFIALCQKFCPQWEEGVVGGNYFGIINSSRFEEMLAIID